MGQRGPKPTPPESRFWAQVDKSGPTARAELGPCWDWTGKRLPKGYGQLSMPPNKHVGAHRFSWSLHYGPIPDGRWVLHKCDRPCCVNPAHLFLGDGAMNASDMVGKGRAATGLHLPHTKLTDDDVRSIRLAVANGQSMLSVSKRFSVNPSHVSRIVSWQTRRHVA